MRNSAKYLASFCIVLFIFGMFSFVNIIHAVGFAVHITCESISLGSQGSVTIAGTTYTNGQTGYYVPGQAYSITGNPSSPTPDNWYFGWWVVFYVGSQASYVDNVYSQTTNLHLNSEVYLTAEFYTPLQANSPTSPITWGTRERITGTAGQCDNGESLTVSYYTHGSGMGPKSQNGQPPFGPLPSGGGYLWTTVTVSSKTWDTGLIYPTLPISLGQQLPQTYDVYAIWGSGGSSERDSNVVSFTLNPATPQIAAPTLTPTNIQLGQSVTIADEIFSSAFVNGNDLTGTLTVQAMKQGTSSWTDVASQSFSSNYGYSTKYGQYGDYYDLSTSWTPSETGAYNVRVIYNGNHYYLPISNPPSSTLNVGSSQHKLTVSSAHDSPSPANGDSFWSDGQSVTCSVTSPVTEGSTVWTCTGWTGTGSVPPSGTSNTVTFTITQDSSITWNWQGAAVHYTLTVNSDHDTPVPSIGPHTYNDGDPIVCSVTSPVTEGGTVWTCTGWTGTGSVPSSGSGTSTGTFYMHSDSTITWDWQSSITQHTLTVSSLHDSPSPSNGPHTYNDGDPVTCSVTSPVTEGSTIWTCAGWTGTGSVPASGTGSSTGPFTITQDSSITWNWHGNSPPESPQFYNPPIKSGPNVQGTWYASADDPDDDLVSITFNWDDGTQNTVGPASSGSTQICQHSYTHTGMYQVKAMATDVHGAKSDWSAPAEVTILTADNEGSAAGYVVRSTSQSITSVDGRWYVPAFGTEKRSVNGIWVGIGGYKPPGSLMPVSLLQAGIDAETNPDTGTTFYCAFMEMINLGLDFTGPVRDDPSKSGCWIFVGDAMEASVSQLSTGNWNVQVKDMTRGWTITWSSITWTIPEQEAAQWIFEPGAGNSNLPSSFGTISFGSATLGIGSTVYELGQVGHNLNTELYDYNYNYKSSGTVTSTSMIHDYKNFDISDTGTRPTSQSLVPITSLSLHSSAELHVYDSSGNHLGYNLTTGFIDDQIPNSFYFEENGVQYAFLFGADTYTISVVGVQDGDFHLHTEIVSNDTTTLDRWTNETILINETKTYNLVHGICLENVEKSKTLIAEGENASIIVLVTNNGNYTETFNVTAYANTTIIGQQLVTLTSANSTIIPFAWSTAGFALGNYTISVYAIPVPGETDTTDNNCTGGWVLITKVGDLGSRVEVSPGPPPVYANEFFVCDGLVTSADLSLFLLCYRGQGP